MSEHETTIKAAETTDAGTLYHASCSCGWAGTCRPARFMAADDASRHHRLTVTVDAAEGSGDRHEGALRKG